MGYTYGRGYGHTWRPNRRVAAPAAPAAVGGGALLVGETAGFATDFTYATDAQRVAVKVAGVNTSYALDAFFQNAGTSPKLVYDSAGVLGWSPHNLILQSQTFDNASWTKSAATVGANAIAAPDGTTTADALIPNNGSVLPYVSQVASGSAVVGAIYTGSVYVKNGTLGTPWFQIALISTTTWRAWFNLSTGVKGTSLNSPISYTMTSVGSGWYRVDMTVLPGTTSVTIYCLTVAADGDLSTNITGNGTSPSFYAWGAQLNRGSTPTAYLLTTTAFRYGLAIDYDPVTHVPLGLLVEPAATNTATRNSELDNAAWGKTASTVSANATTAPNGLGEADAVIPNAGAGRQYVALTITTTNTAVTTYSAFVKNGTLGNNWLEVQVAGTPTVTGWFNLATGVKGTSTGSPISYTITSVGNSWYRVAVTFTAGSTSTIVYHAPDAADGSTAGVTGNGSSPAFYAWGAQMEVGSVATSPIPTFAATVTRGGDGYYFTSAQVNYSATAGSWWIEHYISSGAAVNSRIIAATASNTSIYRDASNFNLHDTTALAKAVSPMFGVIHKTIIAFQSGDRAITVNGLAVASDAGSTVGWLGPGSLIYLGTITAGVSTTLGYIRKVRYLPRRPSNAELQTITEPNYIPITLAAPTSLAPVGKMTWNAGTGVLSLVGALGAESCTASFAPLATVGKTYRIRFNVDALAGDSFSFRCGNTIAGEINSTGAKNFTVVAGTVSPLFIVIEWGGTLTNLTLSNIRVDLVDI